MEDNKEDSCEHIIFLQHGLHGKSSDFDKLEATLKTISKCKVISSNLNWRWFQTTEGVDAQGNDLYRLVIDNLQYLKRDKNLFITFIGHSLGGLSARYCIGLMEKNGDFEKYSLIPKCYISVASPHLGVRPRLNIHGLHNNGILSFLDSFKPVAKITGDTIELILSTGIMGKTGNQLLLNDNEEQMTKLSDPEECFMKGLARFTQRITIINHTSEFQVPFYTSAMMLNFDRTPAEASLSVLDLHKEPSISLSTCNSEEASLLEIPEDIKQDKHFDKIQSISNNLNSLSWKRYHVEMDSLSSHLMILKHPQIVSLIHSIVSPAH